MKTSTLLSLTGPPEEQKRKMFSHSLLCLPVRREFFLIYIRPIAISSWHLPTTILSFARQLSDYYSIQRTEIQRRRRLCSNRSWSVLGPG